MAASYSYDSAGNLQAMRYGNGVTNLYRYDSRNRLTGATVNGTNLFLEYDGDGNRVGRQVNYGIATYYVVDDRNPSGYAQVLEEYQADPSQYPPVVQLSRTYAWGLALISQQRFDPNTLQPSGLSYYGFDGHGSVRFLLDTNGEITDTYTYDAFGTRIAANGTTPNNYLYAGQQYDPDLGLYYNRARYLDTDTGRFWTRDGDYGNNEDPLSLHKYLYGTKGSGAATDTGTISNPDNRQVQSGVYAGDYAGIQDLAFHNDANAQKNELYAMTGYPLFSPEIFEIDPVTKSVGSPIQIGGQADDGGQASTNSDGFTVLSSAGQ